MASSLALCDSAGFQSKELAPGLTISYNMREGRDRSLVLNLLVSDFQSEELVLHVNGTPFVPLRMWSNLPKNVLTLIAENHLHSVDDFVEFSLVCRSWHRAATACNMGKLRRKWVHNQIAWLMLPDFNIDVDEEGYSKPGFVLPRVLNDVEEWEDDSELTSEARSGGEELYTRRVVNLKSNRSYNIKCPELYGRSCWGSPYGWIVTAGSDGKMFMLNPLTKTRVSLPSFATFRRRWDNEEDVCRNHYVKRAVVLYVGADDDAQSYGDDVENLRVVAFYAYDNVAIAKPGNSRRWVEIEGCTPIIYSPLVDVAYDSERGLVFVDRCHGLARCNLPENNESPVLEWIVPPVGKWYLQNRRVDSFGAYILKLGADLLMITKVVFFLQATDERLRVKSLADEGIDISSYVSEIFRVYRFERASRAGRLRVN